MSRILIVPNKLRDGINAEIDRALAGRPIADDERQGIYDMMLEHFDEHGHVPSIDLTKKESQQ